MMRVSLLLVLVAILSLLALVHCLPDASTHVDAMEQHELDLDIQQQARTTPTPTTTPTRTTPRTPTTPTPTRTPARTRARHSPRSPLTGLLFPRRDPFRLDPDLDFRMSPRVIRFSMLERRMLRRMFRAMLRQRMREMFGLGYPMSHMEMRVIRMITLRDMMEAMDVQAQDAAELAAIVDQREADMDDNEAETYDDTETEAETEAEPEIETEHETEAMPDDTLVEHDIEDPRLIDPTLIESEFDISAPYGGVYGGFGGYGSKKGGFGYGGGFGGKKGGFGGGFGFGGKKIPYKKVPYKKVPFPVKKGGFGYGGYGYGGKKGGFY